MGTGLLHAAPKCPAQTDRAEPIDEVKDDLAAAIELVLDVMREDALGQAPPDAVRDTVVVE